MTAEPDVGPAFAAAGFADAALKRVESAGGVGRGGLGLAEHLAKIEKVLLAREALEKEQHRWLAELKKISSELDVIRDQAAADDLNRPTP